MMFAVCPRPRKHWQVALMAGTGVFISMHGAGLMNEIFLPPGAAVIEVFPVHHKHVLYERIAHYAGIYHFKVHPAPWRVIAVCAIVFIHWQTECSCAGQCVCPSKWLMPPCDTRCHGCAACVF